MERPPFGHHHALRAYSALPHANTRAAGASHALLQAHRVKTARTSPRARKHAQRHFRAVPMCVCPVLAPHGRPAPPAPAARPSHYQSKPHIHSRRDARAAAHLTSTPAPFCALCRLCRLLLASHKRLYQDAPRVRRRFGTAQARTHARTRARARARFRSLLHRLPACTHSIQHHVHAYA